jgi:threonine dehydrogenase-like Zn-dependent dehydrogenase
LQLEVKPLPQMKAAIFVEPGRIVLESKSVPDVGPLDALVRVTTTTICGTDAHILKGEYPVRKGIDHRVRACRHHRKARFRRGGLRRGPAGCRRRHHAEGPQLRLPVRPTLSGRRGPRHGFKAIGGWKFGNTIDGCQAEFVLLPDAMANLSPMPAGSSDDLVLMCPDIMSTGFSGAESGGVRIGDTVAVLALGQLACVPRQAPG